MPFKSAGFDKAVTNQANKLPGPKNIKEGFERLQNGRKIKAYKYFKGFFTYVDDPTKIFRFQFNPSEIKDSRSTNYDVKTPIQSEQPIYQHLSRGERTVTFQLFLNGLEPANGTTPFAKGERPFENTFGALGGNVERALEGAVAFGAQRIPFGEGIGSAAGQFSRFFGNPPPAQEKKRGLNVLAAIEAMDDFLSGGGNTPPPKLRFSFQGYNKSQWIVTDISLNTNMWDGETRPLHVFADVTMKEVAKGTEVLPNNDVFLVSQF